MTKILGLIAYILVAAMALKFLGSWTLCLSLGIPLLVVAGYAVYFAIFVFHLKSGTAKRGAELRGDALAAIELLDNMAVDRRKSWLDNMCNSAPIQGLSLSFKSNNGYLPSALLELSNKFLGKFIGYMLFEREYPDKLYVSILRNLRKQKDRNVDEVIVGVGIANPAAMEKLKSLINGRKN